MNKKAIVVTSFGTSFTENLKLTIDKIYEDIRSAFPDYETVQAFTSAMVIKSLKAKGLHKDTVDEALQKLLNKGVEAVYLQPTHIMDGIEYEKITALAAPYKKQFETLSIGAPLLYNDSDFTDTARFYINLAKAGRDENCALVLMGHGSEHPANAVYERLNETFSAMGADTIYVGTVEAKPDIADVQAKLKSLPHITKVRLLPFMVVAGDHATNDMAGNEGDSWKSILCTQGYDVTCVLKGMGEYPEIRKMYVDRLRGLLSHKASSPNKG